MGKCVNEHGFCVYTGLWWKLALPQVIIPVHLAICGATSVWAASQAGSGWTTVAAGGLLGFLIWTFFEYVFHRWLLHHTRHPLLRKIFWNCFHREHHMYPDMEDPDPHGIHPVISVPIALVLVGSVGLLTESGWRLALVGGWLFGYCVYEALHWLFHAGNPEQGLGRLSLIKELWDAHTVHHLYRANKNYGFMTTLWDKCFDTYLTLEEARAQKSFTFHTTRRGVVRDGEKSRYLKARDA